MKKLKNVGFIYELVVLRAMGFYQSEYCPFWDEWLNDTLTGEFEFSNVSQHTVELKNKETGVKRIVWICNHPYASIEDVTNRNRPKNRPSLHVMNLFINNYNEYVEGKEAESNKAYYQELFDNKR